MLPLVSNPKKVGICGTYASKNGVDLDMQLLFAYDNGYGASVVRHGGSYGGRDGLWELAILTKDGICYDTPITDDVIGWQTLSEVEEILAKIRNLPAREGENLVEQILIGFGG